MRLAKLVFLGLCEVGPPRTPKPIWAAYLVQRVSVF